jgi:hypothetical protein
MQAARTTAVTLRCSRVDVWAVQSRNGVAESTGESLGNNFESLTTSEEVRMPRS